MRGPSHDQGTGGERRSLEGGDTPAVSQLAQTPVVENLYDQSAKIFPPLNPVCSYRPLYTYTYDLHLLVKHRQTNYL